MRCAICPRAIDDLRREGAPLRQCGRASLLVYEPGDEMPLLIEWLWTYKAARKLEWTEFYAQLGKRLEIMKQLFHDRARKARRSWLISSSSGQLGGVAARDMRPRRILRARLRIAWVCARDPGGGFGRVSNILGVPPARMGFGLSSRLFNISLSLLVGRKERKAGHVGPR